MPQELEISIERSIFSKAHIRWVRLGCSLLTTLVSSPEGVRYLGSEDQFLPQVVKGFDQLDPVSRSYFNFFLIFQ